MTTEKIERNKWIDAVGKLISLTQERKLLWRVTYGQATGWDSPPTFYEATYGSKTLRLSGHQLYLVEPESDAAWEFPVVSYFEIRIRGLLLPDTLILTRLAFLKLHLDRPEHGATTH